MVESDRTRPCPACAHGPAVGLGRVSAAMVSHDAGSHSCPPGQSGHDHPVVRLLSVVSGELELTVGERCISVGAGEGVFITGETPYSYAADGAISYVAADLCADRPGALSALPEACVPLSTPSLIAAVSTFVARAFASTDASQAAATSAASQRAQVLAHIAAHHAETELSVATLAADLGLSTRSLQRLFAGQRRGIAEEIVAARLDHALALLRNPLLADATLEEIAARSGFRTVPRMRRAIQAATGRNPREHRALHTDAGEREPRVRRLQATPDAEDRVELPMAG